MKNCNLTTQPPISKAVKVAAKRTILTASAFFLAFWAFFTAAFSPIGALAAEVDEKIYLEDTTIESDLAEVDLTQFPADGTGKPRIMDDVGFAEYAYSPDEEIAAHYGVYLYVYNPSEREIAESGSVANMAIIYGANGDPTGYANIDLEILDFTDDHRFYKMRVDYAALYDNVTEYAAAHDGVRRYDIAGLQIMYADGSNAEDFGAMSNDYGYTYRVTGFAKGCGEDPNAESTLDVKEDRLTIVPLEVHQTYYRMGYINENGSNHVDQITSVYFAIPEETATKYGELYTITAEWDERRTTPVIVTTDSDVFADVSANIGKSEISGNYMIFDNYYKSTGSTSLSSADWGYGPSDSTNFKRVVSQDTTPVGWVFQSSEADVMNERISSAEMLAYAEAHGFADYLFTDDVDEGRKYGKQSNTFRADEPFDLLSFNSTASGWDKFVQGWEEFWSFGKKDYDWGGEAGTVEPIHRVTDADLSGLDEDNAEKLYINEDDYGAFERFYNENQGGAVYLFRFAVTDYYSAMQTVFEDSFFAIGESSSTYMARETVFLDFDIIDLGFMDENGVITVLPVVADPLDIIAGIDPPPVTDYWELVWWLTGTGGVLILGAIFGAKLEKIFN